MSSTAYFPSHPDDVRTMLALADVGPNDVVYDLGCGDGRILIMAVQEFHVKKAVGIEVETHIFTLALHNVHSQNLQDKIHVIRGDLFDTDISEATVIVFYLTTEAIKRLKPKLMKEAKPGTRIVSNGHTIPGWKISRKQFVDQTHAVSLYVIPNAFQQDKERKSSLFQKIKRFRTHA